MNKAQINKYCRKMGFEIHGTGYVQSVLKRSFREDPFAKQKELCPSAAVIFDVGANHGGVVPKYLDLFPSARIHAFEPYADSFETLRQRHADNPMVRCHRLAIADSELPKTLYVK